ncbi:hypothetical protein BJX70DRAFT_155992 [Aspergillus crustosus]
MVYCLLAWLLCCVPLDSVLQFISPYRSQAAVPELDSREGLVCKMTVRISIVFIGVILALLNVTFDAQTWRWRSRANQSGSGQACPTPKTGRTKKVKRTRAIHQ